MQQNKERRRKYVKKDSAIVKDRRHLVERQKRENYFFSSSNFVHIFLTRFFDAFFSQDENKILRSIKKTEGVKITFKESF